MARKRLTPAQTLFLDTEGALAPQTSAIPPIAQVAGANAAEAALEAVAAELRAAEDEGRMIRALPLDRIDTGYLRRDRIAAEPEAQSALVASLRARGQQTPIEVEALPAGADGQNDGQPRFGLISGWRRVLALRSLHEETGDDRFATALALVRRPKDSPAAYVAMVEENEIREGLSFYERARVVRRAVEAGAFPTEKAALQALFAGASAPKRSKIKSFIAVVAEFDGLLRFPTHIPERTGLAIAKGLENPQFAHHLEAALRGHQPDTPEAEAQVIARVLAARKPRKTPRPGLRLTAKPGRVVLEGAAADAAFAARLQSWLKAEGLA